VEFLKETTPEPRVRIRLFLDCLPLEVVQAAGRQPAQVAAEAEAEVLVDQELLDKEMQVDPTLVVAVEQALQADQSMGVLDCKTTSPGQTFITQEVVGAVVLLVASQAWEAQAEAEMLVILERQVPMD
jgi:predicted deacylase